jgi:hypothetical protein
MSNDAKDQNKAVAVFRELVKVLEEAPFDYAIGGGICTDHWIGNVKTIEDIDVVVREPDTAGILEALSEAGYEVTEMDHSWLHKAFKDEVTVDLMFELKNGTRFDDLFRDHRTRADLFGTMTYVMSAEDQVASLAGTADRQTVGRHWYSLVDIAANNDLQWDYVIARAQTVPLRMLSATYFLLSEKVPVPKGVIEQLEELVDSMDR